MNLKYPNHPQGVTTPICAIKQYMMEISVFGSQGLDAERRRSPSLAVKVLRDSFNSYNVSSFLFWLAESFNSCNFFSSVYDHQKVFSISTDYISRYTFLST